MKSSPMHPGKWPLTLLWVPGLIALVKACSNPVVGADGLRYLFPIHNWLAGHGWTFLDGPEVLYPPGYGVTAWFFYLLWPDIEFSGIAVSVVSYALLAPTTYILFRRVGGETGAWIGGLLVCLQPGLLGNATTTMTENLYTLVCIALFAAALALWNTPQARRYGLAVGLLAGYGALIRPEMMGVGGALLTLLLGRGLVLARKNVATLLPVSLAIFIFAACVVGYGFMLKEISGHFAFTGKGVTSMHTMENRENRTEMASPTSGYGQSIVAYFLAKDYQWLQHRVQVNLWRERHMMTDMLLTGLLPFFLALYLSRFFRRLQTEETWPVPPLPPLSFFLLGAAFTVPLAVYPLFIVNERLLTPVASILLLMLGVMTGWLLSHYHSERPWLAHLMLVTSLVGVVLLRGSSLLEVVTAPPGHQGLREAGEWLATRQDTMAMDKMAAPRKRMVISFYAFNKERVLPELPIQSRFFKGDLSELLQRYRELGLTHLVLDNQYAFDFPPLAQVWREGKGEGLQRVYESPTGRFKVFALAQGVVQGGIIPPSRGLGTESPNTLNIK